MNIYDRARQMVQQARSTLTLQEALSRLGKRGARVRIARREAKRPQPAPTAWWNDPER